MPTSALAFWLALGSVENPSAQLDSERLAAAQEWCRENRQKLEMFICIVMSAAMSGDDSFRENMHAAYLSDDDLRRLLFEKGWKDNYVGLLFLAVAQDTARSAAPYASLLRRVSEDLRFGDFAHVGTPLPPVRRFAGAV